MHLARDSELGKCHIGKRGAQSVLTALRKSRNSTLRILGLLGNDDAIEEMLPEIYDLLEKNDPHFNQKKAEPKQPKNVPKK